MGWTLKPEGQRHGGVLSVWQRLIEREGTARSGVGNGYRIGGVELAGVIEREDALGRRPSRRQWRGTGGEIEIGEDGVYGNGILMKAMMLMGAPHDGQSGRTS